MFNYSVVLAGHDTVTETCRVTTCRCSFKSPTLQEKTKIDEPSIHMAFIQKPLEDFRQRESENFIFGILVSENDPKGPRELQIQKKNMYPGFF